MRRRFYKVLLPFIMHCLLVCPAFGQASQNPVLTGWNEYLSIAVSKQGVEKADKLLDWCDSALLNFFNGKRKEDEVIFNDLLDKTELLCAKNYPDRYSRCLLLKSRFYFIQNRDREGSDLHNKALSYFAHASNSEIAPAMFLLSNAWRYHTTRTETMVNDSNYYKTAVDYYNSVNDPLKSASIQRTIAFLYIQAGHPEKSVEKLQKLYQLQVKIGDLSRHKTLDLLAHCNAVTGNYRGALDYAFASLSYVKTIKDSLDFGVCFMRLGRILRDLSDTTRAAMYFNLALQEFKKEKDDYAAVDIEVNLNRMRFGNTGRNQEALNNLLRLNKQYGSVFGNNDYLHVFILEEIGLEYFALKHFERAEFYFQQSIELAKSRHLAESNMIPLYNYLADLYLKQGKLNKALVYLNQSLAFAKETHSLPMISTTENKLFEIDSIKGNYVSALGHFRLYKDAEDSMFNQTKSRQEAELNIKYETAQKEKQNQLLSEKNKLQEKDILQATFVRKAMIAGVCMLLIILFFVFNQYRTKHRTTMELEIKQKEINDKNLALEKLITEEELLLKEKDHLLEDKEWLLKEIHHRVKNNLQIVMSLLNSQTAHLSDATALQAIRESQSRVHAISLIHQKLYQSDNLSMTNMEVYIHELSDYLADNLDTGNRIFISTFAEPIELDVALVVPLGLIINEAVTNAIKYAFPANASGQINIEFKKDLSGRMLLSIHDNGMGFSSNFNWEESQSLGISLMRGLSKQINGHFAMSDQKGVKVCVLFTPDSAISSLHGTHKL